MLAGRESLIRLVGKRKRTLSSSVINSLLLEDPPPPPPLPPLPPPCLLSETVADGDSSAKSPLTEATAADCDRGVSASSSRHGGKKDEDQTCGSNWVDCPVCGNSIHSADYAVNHHLDSCLARGTKRKLTQRTLLQFNFFSKSSNQLSSNDLHNEDKYVRQLETDVKNEKENLCSVVSELGSDHTCGIKECVSESLLCSQVSQEICNCIAKDTSNVKVDDTESIPSTCCFSIVNVDKLQDCAAGHTGTMLETFIVGRRFHDNVELWPGASISILREPENANDHHAIKVFCTISGCEKILGYLPRELAKYISPLIEMYGLKFEGFVTSLPKRPFDAIPINLVCEEMVPYGRIERSNVQVFESLWESAVQGSKNFPLKKMRYQKNFHIMIQEVMSQHAHLFTDDEKSFLGSFGSLSDDSQKFFIRLYTRKGPWFRMSNMCYPEVLDSEKASKELQLAGYVISFHTILDQCENDMREVSDTLTTSELREIRSLLLLKKGSKCTKKLDLIDSLCSAYRDGTWPMLPGILSEKAGICMKISSIAELLLWRVQRLFFLNGEQDLSAFLLVDLGLVKYPSYICNVSQPIFDGRNNFLAYEEAIEVAQIMDQSLGENNVKMVNRCINISDSRISSVKEMSQFSSSLCGATFLSCFSASWVYSKVVMLGVSFLEHEHSYEEAVKLLKGLLQRFRNDGRRGYWTFRLSVDLEHTGLISESLSVAEEGVLDPWVRAGSKIALQRRVLRLGKPPRRWKIPNFAASVKRKIKEVHVRGRPLNCEMGKKTWYYGYNDGQCGVEQLALQYYSTEGGGWQGAHTESGIWMTIFGLLMWDVLFADTPDVFRNRFQTAPLDLDSDSFYGSRRDLIESQLQKVQHGMAEEILIISWQSHAGTACRGVNWNNHSLSDLRAAVSCIGGCRLSSMCRLLAQDYRSWSSGMPDLLLWRFHGDGNTGEAKLVEVKGLRDRLSEQQRAWMLFLMDSGFDTEVCRVSPDL